MYTFQHFPRDSIVGAYVTEIGRILRPGGFAVVQTWNRELTWLRRIKLALAADFGGVGYSETAFASCLSSFGLQVIRSETGGVGNRDVWVWAQKPDAATGR